MVTLRAGGWLVGVEYDDEDARAAIVEACGRWLVPDGDVPAAAFGLRTAKVGFRRRRVGLVHHGAPIRWRRPSLGDGAATLAEVMSDLDHAAPPGLERVTARCFVRDERAVLADVPASRELDDAVLQRAGITEVPAWRPQVDPEALTVHVNGRSWPLAGLALGGRGMSDLTMRRRHAWTLAPNGTVAWAWAIDRLDGRIRSVPEAVEPLVDELLAAET